MVIWIELRNQPHSRRVLALRRDIGHKRLSCLLYCIQYFNKDAECIQSPARHSCFEYNIILILFLNCPAKPANLFFTDVNCISALCSDSIVKYFDLYFISRTKSSLTILFYSNAAAGRDLAEHPLLLQRDNDHCCNRYGSICIHTYRVCQSDNSLKEWGIKFQCSQ